MIDPVLNYGRHLIERYLELLLPFQSILDLGAGYGTDLMLAKKINPSASLYAIEVYTDYALKLIEKGIVVHSINIENEILPFKDESINIIIANQILEHTKEIFWIFHEVSRVLTVGGKLIIGVPNLASLHNRLLLMLGLQPTSIKINSAHIRGFTKKDFLNFLQSCFPGGYELKAFDGSNFYPFPPVIALPLARLFPTMAWGIFFVFEKKLPYTNQFIDFPDKKKSETNFYVGA